MCPKIGGWNRGVAGWTVVFPSGVFRWKGVELSDIAGVGPEILGCFFEEQGFVQGLSA